MALDVEKLKANKLYVATAKRLGKDYNVIHSPDANEMVYIDEVPICLVKPITGTLNDHLNVHRVLQKFHVYKKLEGWSSFDWNEILLGTFYKGQWRYCRYLLEEPDAPFTLDSLEQSENQKDWKTGLVQKINAQRELQADKDLREDDKTLDFY